jgi:hypothetical protein
MNIYRQKFTAVCPNNERVVDYLLTIRSRKVIMVEEIQTAVCDLRGYHEEFADKLFARFGGQQVISAHHHGTDIETERP